MTQASDDQPLARVRVLYVAGTGRSGSTLLAGILGQVDGVFNAGEVRYLWERGLKENRLCGCGRPFNECPVWKEILEEAGSFDARAMFRTQGRLTRVRRLPAVMLGLRDRTNPEVTAYREGLGRLYRAIAHVSGCAVIVDSSKLPSYGRVLGSLPGIDLQVVQLVRDPRSAAGSWAGVKEQPDRGVAGSMQRLPPAHSALLWSLWNSTSRRFVGAASNSYMVLRYEDFVAAPVESVRRVAALVGKGDAKLPFVDATTVELAANHTVSGNPDRLRSGSVTIASAGATRKKLSSRQELVVTALTLPILVRFGYPISFRPKSSKMRPVGIQHLPEPLRTWRRLQRHWRWGREEGFGRLVEEDQLDPRARLAGASRRREWRRDHPIVPGSTTAVFLVGLQRSGTNMVARALEANPEFEVRNENDRAVFDRFRLKPVPVVRDLVAQCGQPFLVLKPLIDSHRVDDLLDGLGNASAPKALWTYRGVDGRVRSALSKFGDHNLEVLRAIAEGRAADVWQAQRLSPQSVELVRALDLDRVTGETAGAVIWYLRNSLYFELSLDRRDDCLLISYERALEDPELEIGRVCRFVGADFQKEMVSGIARRGASDGVRLELDPLVRARCDDLERRLGEACASPPRV